MHEIPHFDQVALLLVAGVGVALLLGRLHLPTIASLLAAGAVVGPFGFRLVAQPAVIQGLAEVGVILLLFTIGLEFSLPRLRQMWRQVLVGGSLQVGLTIAVVLGVGGALGVPAAQGLFLGFLFALSSTAVVLRVLTDRREIDTPHGRLVMGVLIFQDLCVVPMLITVPLLAGDYRGSLTVAILLALAKAAVMVVVVLGAGRLLIGPLLNLVGRQRDIFLMVVMGLCVGIAWLTSHFDLSLALGAFLAGLIIADTDHGHLAFSDMVPVRDVFSSIFFMSMGMLFDPRAVLDHPLAVALLLAGLVLVKGFLATVAAITMRFPARTAWLAGVGLAQFGEFGFVLASAGNAAGLLTGELAKQILAAGALSMFFTPIAVQLAPDVKLAERILRPLERLLRMHPVVDPVSALPPPTDHVVIVGYGTAGHLLSLILRDSNTPFVVIDADAERVRVARGHGATAIHGDATRREALEEAGVGRAKVLAVLTGDLDAVRRIIALGRHISTTPAIVAQADPEDTMPLRRLGADHVVSGRVETGLEFAERILDRLGHPGEHVSRIIETARESHSEPNRKPSPAPRTPGL